MNVEKILQHSEPQREINQKRENAEILIGKMSLPDSVKKAVIGVLAGTVGVMAVEGVNIQSANATEAENVDDKFEMQLPSEMQKAVDEIKSGMLDGKKMHFDNAAKEVGLEDEQIVSDISYSYDYEQSGENPQFAKEINKDIAMEGDDVYVVEYQSLGVVAYDEEDSGKIWEKLSTDTQIFTFESIDVKSIGEAMSFEGTGLTKNEAILDAFDRVGDLDGIIVGVEKTLQDSFSDVNNREVEAKSIYTSSISSSYNIIIDHYEVVNIESVEDGGYKVKLEVALGAVE
jgi:hypothetical protein